MQTHVYANGLEIAAKAVGSDGSSAQAFPDPCWSPPAPSAGPIVIPYPNTCYAGTITNGTKTVFIGGQQVAIEDHSYFSTSIGNEPATHAFNKGVKTGVITGKAHFAQWSFNVVFEGYGVPRHTDLVSHNHGSMPSNTPLFPYLSRGAKSPECRREAQRIERACEKEADHSDTRTEIRKKNKVLGLLKRKGGKKKTGDDKNWHWTDDHCDGMHININTYAKAKEYAEQMKEVYEKLPQMLDVMGALESELKSMATKAGAKAFGKWAAKAGAKQALGSAVPAWGNAVMAVVSVVEGVIAIGDVNEIRRVALESLNQLDILKSKLSDLKSLSERFKNYEKLSEKEILKLAAEGQDVLATVNACTRARKCNLVPKSNKDGSTKVETADNGGCCPGQTGHHLIYDAMMTDAGCGKNYHYGKAPTVCTEGFSQHHGSHSRVHDQMDRQVQDLADAGKLQNGTMSMDQAIDAAVKSHSEAFRLSRCSESCIRAQLVGYYKNCADSRPKAVDKEGVPTKPRTGDGSSI